MKILVAEDDPVSCAVLERTLKVWAHEAVIATDGATAWEILQRSDAPKLAILDWMMPGIDGVELCRRVRSLSNPEPTYLILLTAKQLTENVVAGLNAGANDYVTKPFDRRELQARIRVAERMISLQQDLVSRVRELEAALNEVNQLQGLLPICSCCKSVRSDQSYWQQVDAYLTTNCEVRVRHSICPDCWEQVVTASGTKLAAADKLQNVPLLGSCDLATHSLPT